MAFRDAKRCEATAKSTGERCKNPAVEGRAVCRVHGGKAGAPKGNQNAKTHGGYATIFDGVASEEERRLAEPLEKEDLLQEQFALARMRARSVLRWLKADRADGMADPVGAQHALTAIQREIRQLIKLKYEMEADREQEQDKIDDLIDRFDQVRDEHTDGYEPGADA